jgi:hypothetical protein
MSSEAMREILQLIDAKAQSRPTPMEFELAYQARVAMDRIRFAIKHTEQFAPQTEHMQEAGLQLLDALERLESAERSFQLKFRVLHGRADSYALCERITNNGHANRCGS